MNTVLLVLLIWLAVAAAVALVPFLVRKLATSNTTDPNPMSRRRVADMAEYRARTTTTKEN